MKLALALLLIAGCGSSAKHDSTSPTSGPPPTSGSASAVNGATTAAHTQNRTQASSMTTTAGGGHYSCFDYKSRGSVEQRHACMSTSECDPYRDQAMQVGGIIEVSGCASVAAIYCFHQPASKTDPEGLDVCQPSMDTCKSERALLVKKGTSVDTDCAAR